MNASAKEIASFLKENMSLLEININVVQKSH